MFSFWCYRHLCKEQVSVTLSIPLRATFKVPSRESKLTRSFALSNPSIGFFPGIFAVPSNSKPTSTSFLMPNFTKDDLQRIRKTVLESKTSITLRYFDKSQNRSFKAKALNMFKNKSHMDCNNLIQQYKDHFIMSKTRSVN